MMLSRFLNVGTNWFGLLMIARLGEDALATTTLITALFTPIQIGCWSVFLAVGVISARSMVRKQYNYCAAVLRQAVILGPIIALPMIALLYCAEPLLKLAGQPAHLISPCSDYLQIIALSLLPSLFCINAQQFLYGIGKPRLALTFSALTSVNILTLTYLFIHGNYGLPELGINALAVANVIAYSVTFLLILLFFYYSPALKKFSVWQKPKAREKKIRKKILKVGLPITGQSCAELGALSLAVFMMGSFGPQALAAQQIVTQCSIIAMLIPLGIAHSVSIFVSQAKGQGHSIQQLRAAGYIGMAMAFALMLIISFIYLFHNEHLLRLYTDEPLSEEIYQLASAFFIINAFTLLANCIRTVMAGFLRGLYETKFTMFNSFLCYWGIALPTGIALAFIFTIGPLGLRYAMLIALIIASLLLIRRFLALTQHHNKKITAAY
ncbi:MATE family efflux transporter [Piscirickettsia litoralis]|uniref:Multidrug-efflux transporter n=2 Tax=Piscirickettsia litoralis TaxID=1891921 RepID=A0ABX3A2R4_9GAMM|nr:MATE family efflux transporter [Piscirickettsia litoralis]